ncbi:hypothetical protein KIN20_024584 [Parelaphostrongylus tenuis]|uniref:Acireductone dioxygenase n=1 Tax=Parelaphostrongylus tenuis TaxID=148309 RepID=A0AAD5MHB8_PARTN|nr:hypothetical protein KIN20_017025 [Parelaphostrongylus tenuis]KAJ1358880.1 hypothetical protein KIN20_017433 [Parelaphostrongylus tenuis]KAJ1364481.1 hypothetical protein KIN20_024584 [Parelaphostrongylus tenuis]
MPIGAYYMGSVDDPRDDCRMDPNRDATNDDLDHIGVKVSKIDMNSDWEKYVDNLMTVYGMNYRDEIQINRASMPDFDEKVKKFYEEHLHRDPEVRFIKSGTGFFDVRSAEDEWIRIPVESGDFLSLPAGIYHRFTTDRNENLVTIRMFQSNPSWISYARCKDGDSVEERNMYLKGIGIEN